jgi:5-methylcytosine-specific restriction endonuclease McrA
MSPIMRACLGTAGHRCRKLIPPSETRCPSCQSAKYQQRAASRDPAAVNLYGSAAWRSLADRTVAEAEACHWCGTSAAIAKLTADHILPVRRHPDLALEEENVVAACRGCQERRKRRPDPRTWAEWERRPLR